MGEVIQFPRARVVPRTGLTRRQLKALRFIESYIARHGKWPTFTEVALAAGLLSKMGAVRVVNQLFRAGAISRPERPGV